MINVLIVIVYMIALTGCYPDPNKIALRANLHKELHYNHDFIITSYTRDQNKLDISQPLIVYIEGDGRAWISKYRLSSNPTPVYPLALKLATIDNHPNVIYIARPCQFTPLNLDKHCSSKYWSEARYSKEVVDSINQVINNFKNYVLQKHKAIPDIHLVGYSGGATIAGLIASQRDDVKSLRTIAGNLDHDAVSNFHQTSKLTLSLNLINVTKQISHIPQMHYIGEHDQIIPIYVVQNFVNKINSYPEHNCADYKIFNNLDHYHGWESAWAQVVNQIPSCR